MKTLKDHLQRLSWRFRTREAFTPNDNDIRALNALIQATTTQQQQLYDENTALKEIAAKLYCSTYRKLVSHYDWQPGVRDDPQRNINQLLERPYSYHLQQLQTTLNLIHQNLYETPQEPWSLEEVAANMREMINKACSAYMLGYLQADRKAQVSIDMSEEQAKQAIKSVLERYK